MKDERSKVKGQRSKVKGQRAKGKGQRAKMKGQSLIHSSHTSKEQQGSYNTIDCLRSITIGHNLGRIPIFVQRMVKTPNGTP